MVADDHEGPGQPEPLGAAHPHPDAVEALEGQERGAQEPAGDKGRDKAEGHVWRADLQLPGGAGWARLRLRRWSRAQAQGGSDFPHIGSCEAQSSPGST